MTPRTLNVWINDALVGYIREHNGLWAFGYAPAWLASNSAFPVCPGLPLQPEEHLDGASYRPVQWYFDNLLPEEGQRALLAKASAANVEDAFACWGYTGPSPPAHSPCYCPIPALATAQRNSCPSRNCLSVSSICRRYRWPIARRKKDVAARGATQDGGHLPGR